MNCEQITHQIDNAIDNGYYSRFQKPPSLIYGSDLLKDYLPNMDTVTKGFVTVLCETLKERAYFDVLYEINNPFNYLLWKSAERIAKHANVAIPERMLLKAVAAERFASVFAYEFTNQGNSIQKEVKKAGEKGYFLIVKASGIGTDSSVVTIDPGIRRHLFSHLLLADRRRQAPLQYPYIAIMLKEGELTLNTEKAFALVRDEVKEYGLTPSFFPEPQKWNNN